MKKFSEFEAQESTSRNNKQKMTGKQYTIMGTLSMVTVITRKNMYCAKMSITLY